MTEREAKKILAGVLSPATLKWMTDDEYNDMLDDVMETAKLDEELAEE